MFSQFIGSRFPKPATSRFHLRSLLEANKANIYRGIYQTVTVILSTLLCLSHGI